MVIADQGAFDRGADRPVVPDGGVEGEQALDDPRPQPGGDPAAVAFEAKLVLQRPDDCLDALRQLVRERPGTVLVLAGRADEDQAEVAALTSTRSADNTGVRVQVLRRQPDGSWLRIIDRPEVPKP